MRVVLFLALAACASYRVLPPPPVAAGSQQIPVRYEKSRLLLFKSQADDGIAQRAFANGGIALVSIARPQAGMYASSDAGRTWTFSDAPAEAREVLFAPGHVYVRTSNRIWHSADGGATWDGAQVVGKGDSLDTLALGADGAIWTAGRSSLYVSTDHAASWRPVNIQLPPQPAWRVRSIVPDPLHPHIVRVALRTEPQHELLPRFTAVLDFSSDEALSALKVADAQGPAPAWGVPEDGVYVTEDGGGLWKKAKLSMDVWLASYDGALYAAAAEPILQTAALVRRFPDLAGAAERQFKGARADAAVLRAALQYPGREALLAGPAAAAIIYVSKDGGGSWERLMDPPLPVALAVRDAMERGGQDGPHVPPPPKDQKPPADQQRRPQEPQSRPGGMRDLAQRYGPSRPERQGRPQQDRPSGRQVRGLAPQTLLCFVDPQRLLARFNGTAPISAVSGDLGFIPTQQGWDALVSQLIEESTSEREISLGPAETPSATYQLLRGPSWSPAAEALPPGPPQSVASGAGAVYVVRRDGRAFRVAP